MQHVYTHQDGNTVSTRESDRNLDFVVVVKTPVETRHAIRDLVEQVDFLTLDNIDRALSDGTVTQWGNQTYVGGLKAQSAQHLQNQYNQVLEHVKNSEARRADLVDLYQVVGWFEGIQDAQWLAKSLNEEYEAGDWLREAFVDFTDGSHDVPF